jgi:hypothetical protein
VVAQGSTTVVEPCGTMPPCNGNSGGSYGSGGQVRPTNEALVSSLKQLLSSVAVDALTQKKVQQKIAELEAALAGCGGAAVAPSGPMQELTCGGAAGAAQVKFVPFDKAGPNLQAEIAATKASGSRVCFCRDFTRSAAMDSSYGSSGSSSGSSYRSYGSGSGGDAPDPCTAVCAGDCTNHCASRCSKSTMHTPSCQSCKKQYNCSACFNCHVELSV